MADVQALQPIRRGRWLYAVIALIIGVLLVRSFYLQVFRYTYFHQAALADQFKDYMIPAPRGLIEAHSGNDVVPIVLNQKLYTVYADPGLVQHPDKIAPVLASVLGGNVDDYAKKIQTPNTRYVVLAKRVAADKKTALLTHGFPGIVAQEMTYRTYPNGQLASQVLGFVNDDGQGVYGVEQTLNKKLSGQNGQLKAVTDVNGVPLAANTDNVQRAPVAGSNVVLTIDMAMQKQLEGILAQGVKDAKSNSGSALIIEANTGAIKAMANWPTYDPTNYSQVSDPNVFNNAAVSSPLEVGSIMKTLTTAAALDQGVVHADQTYNDPAHWTVDGFTIKNVEEDGGPGTKSIADLLNLSLNTGATWELMQMSKPGGTEINQKGRDAWHDYLVNHYRLGRPTGIEQGYEATGIIPDPDKGYALDLRYANTTFGQGMSATPLQMAAAFSAVVNGGTYYQPHLVDQFIGPDGKVTNNPPKVVEKNVVSANVSKEMQSLLQYVVEKHYLRFDQTAYMVGGKTGTAQIPKSGGGYEDSDFNGTYMGFVGGDSPQYVIMVRVNDPKIGGYAGTSAAQPIFASLAHMLINNFGVAPRS